MLTIEWDPKDFTIYKDGRWVVQRDSMAHTMAMATLDPDMDVIHATVKELADAYEDGQA